MLRRLSNDFIRKAAAPSAPTDPPPLTVQFLHHLVAPGGYGLDEDDVYVGLKQWREAEIIGGAVHLECS